MTSLFDTNFIVVDVETTGSHAVNNRVMDIACVVVRGGEIVEEFSSLVNPHQLIPSYIAEMTGINQGMVMNAPEETEVFHIVRNIFSLPNAVFVAHNVSFDFSFVNNSFLRAGLPPIDDMPKLCTVKLARRLLHKDQKKNLGALAKYYGIENNARHRALGDAKATAFVLMELLDQAEQDHESESLHDVLSLQNQPMLNFRRKSRVLKRMEPILEQLPAEPGVYYMLGSDDKILYIGKAKSLCDRVRSYFQMGAQHPEKIAEMVKRVYNIRWEVTDTELGALLLESREIKIHKPHFNTLNKRLRHYPFLRLTSNEMFPRLEFSYTMNNDGAEYFGPFRSRAFAEEIVDNAKKMFGLRYCSEEIAAVDTDRQPCFYHQIDRCGAPCAGIQSEQSYYGEIDKLRQFLSGFASENIIDRLEREMHECAERLEFENAAVLRNRIREVKRLFERRENVPTSVNQNNLVLVIPASERDKTVEIFFIRAGKLIHQECIGRRASLARQKEKIFAEYFNGKELLLDYSKFEVDELRIITAWTYRRQGSGRFIYTSGKSYADVAMEFENAVRGAFREEIKD